MLLDSSPDAFVSLSWFRQGWAGFAFPLLTTALQTFRAQVFRPSSVPSLTMDGNTAHSSGWWWGHAGAFYFGGSLYYNSNNVLEYNPGRSGDRSPCKVNACELGNCDWGCPADQRTSIRITNTKAFLAAGVGLNSWTGSIEIIGWESHDTGLALESLSDGFWLDKALVVCRQVRCIPILALLAITTSHNGSMLHFPFASAEPVKT
jgi:hypothetical protein